MRNAPKLCPAVPSKRARTRPAGGRRAGSARDRAAEPGADRAVGVRDLERRLDEACPRDRRLPLRVQQRAEPVCLVRHGLADVPRRAGAQPDEQPAEVERVCRGVAGPALAQQIRPAHRLVERPEAETGEELAHLEGDEAKVRLHHLRRPRELRPSSGRWLAIPTGHVSRWHERTIRQPSARRSAVPNEYSSAPSNAATTTSRPVFMPPSTRTRTRPRSPFATRACCVSASPSSHGAPACLIDASGLAPVPPSAPAMCTTSACAFATPAAISPTPLEATSLTDTSASGLTSRRSKTSCARSSIE